ncbi:MAG: tetratricopeptide repeat protein [Bacillus sp. (in: firmicutes)]
MSKDSKLSQSEKIVVFYPTGEYYFSKGLKAYHQRDLYKAKKYLQRAQILEPIEPMIACQLAIICTDLEEYSESNDILDNIVSELDPYMSECHYFLANNYAHLGMFREAYKHASKYIELDQDGEFVDDAEDLLELISLEHNGDLESLLQEDSIRFEQDQIRQHLEKGEFEKAIDLLRATIAEQPEVGSAYNNLAIAYYYSNQKSEAFSTLYEVLEKHPGNLHALCNLVVFHHAEKNEQHVVELVAALQKIRPLQVEHQYKLGATFALIGRYDLAYMWLKKLFRNGFDGDETYYYWLSLCAYQLGFERSAKKAWEILVQMNPDKAGLEPWGEMITELAGFENQLIMIIDKIEHESLSERLFGLFLLKHSEHKHQLLKHSSLLSNKLFTALEQNYVKHLTENDVMERDVNLIDAVAELLYTHYGPISIEQMSLYAIWFAAYEKANQTGVKLANPGALAGAVEYVWYMKKNEPLTQKLIADKYEISVSTLQKYVKIIKELSH